MNDNTVQYRMLSNDMIDTPGLIRWAINAYFFEADQPQLRRVFTQGYGLPDDVAHKLLSRKMNWRVDEDNAVVVTHDPDAD